MLNTKQRLVLTLLFFTALGLSPVVHAAVGDVTINITGCATISGQAFPPTPANQLGTPFFFTASCPPAAPTLTVSQGKVEVLSDSVGGTLDILRVFGVLTANQDVSLAEIKISRVYTAGPNTTSGNVYYKTCANGTLTQDPGRTNSFALTGAVANPLGNIPTQMGGQINYSSSQGMTFTCTVGSTSTTGQWPTPPAPALTGDRLLQEDLIVNLKSGGSMNLSGVNYIKIQSQGSPDEFPTPPGTGSPGQSNCLGLFTQCTTQSTTRFFSWSSDNVAMNEDRKAKAFASASWENLTEDIVRGHGEYLASLASLLKVQPEDQLAFVALAQAHYAMHQEQGTLVSETFVEGLRNEILANRHPAEVATYLDH